MLKRYAKKRAVACGAALILALAWHVAAPAAVTIVANAGPFDSVQTAASAEADVAWSDADPSDDTACTESFAAVELQRYLRRMTGRADDFALADDGGPVPEGDLILVGGPASNAYAAQLAGKLGVAAGDIAALGLEGYRIKVARLNGRLVVLIAGGGRVGTLYGVYDFLYRHGCRWFAPGDVHEEAPALDFGAIADADIAERPEFAVRGFHAWEDRGNDDFLLWMARNRLNYWCDAEDNHPFLRKLGLKLVWGGHVIGTDYLKPGDPYPYAHPQFPGAADLPKDPYPISETYLGDENGDGVLSYREAHPEWYGMLNGERRSTLRDGDVNYCSSNPHATAELLKNAVQELIDGEAKDADIVNCWTVDAGKWCECEACRALGSPTDRNLLFVHRFDQEVKKAQAAGLINRPITLLFLAYSDVLEPPTHPLPEGFDYDTCIATYFPIVRCYVHNFDDPACPKNASYAKHLYGWAVDPERHYKGQICIGEYYNVSGYKCLPICFMHTMANDIPYYYEAMNARYFHYMHVTTGHWGNKALTNYQMARQLWNHGTDCETLWEDYFAKRYGPAAGKMRAFYASLETMLSNVSVLKYNLCGQLSRGSDNLFPDAHLPYAPSPDALGPSLVEIVQAGDACRRILDEAEAMSLPPRTAARIAEDDAMFVYGHRTVRFYDALARAYSGIREGHEGDGRAAFAEASTLAELLRADKTSPSMSSSHAVAADGLSASRAGAALGVLTEILGPVAPEEVAEFDLAAGPVVLAGRDFTGGGGVVYGYGLTVHPEGRRVSDKGNYVYAANVSPHDRMTGWFRLKAAPGGAVVLRMAGLRCPLPPGSAIPGRIAVNDRVVLEGDVPFPEDGLFTLEIVLPEGVLKQGLNKIEVRNTAKKGQLGNRPWFGIDQAELRLP
ncbi:MAG: DUF4838 domain-containing protein [Candidatus Hydrogenedentes bacterium]|nr:DUF4838 domain-containing protein [Candidatus Hydrogenedentota bacterium]